jgi:hypothetical protein
MNPIEIEEAVSSLAQQPFDADEFPFLFLQAFGNKETTLKRLRAGVTNKSDIGGVLQTNHIHMLISPAHAVSKSLALLKASPVNTKAKVHFLLATDGIDFEAEDLQTGETLACAYTDFANQFGFFLPLAGISTVQQIRDSSFDIRATGRLNKLYLELLKDNPTLAQGEQREAMNHFMARLIFCFFAEDTGIFNGPGLFTATIEQMSAKDASDTHWVIGEIFRAMNTRIESRASAEFRPWADTFPYVNGGLFSGSAEVPIFSKVSRSYLLHIGSLDWTQINPDIFGSMIQAVADEQERGALGMHYTSVPNILKVLNPLFLDELREQLEKAGESPRLLLKLRERLAKIRVFDPACGSGNFLVIAYKQLREIENAVNARRGEARRRSEIPLTNFRGIELRHFSAEIARLALIIAEYQCDELYLDQKVALAAFLPLGADNWITCGNALRLDWLSVCPPTGKSVQLRSDDLFSALQAQTGVEFVHEGGETFICGNPPYLGSTWQSAEQKADLQEVFARYTKTWKSLDYVAGWFMKAALYGKHTPTATAFVSTNSICQGQQVPILWPLIFASGHEIVFAHTSFKWANLASHNAGVTVAIVGISNHASASRFLFSTTENESTVVKEANYINAYLVPAPNVIIQKRSKPMMELASMDFGNKPVDGGHLLLTTDELLALKLTQSQREKFIRRIYGSAEFIRGISRYCLWIEDEHLNEAMSIPVIRQRIENVRAMRLNSSKAATVQQANSAHQFGEVRQVGNETVIIVPRVSSESRDYLPVGYAPSATIVSDSAFAFYNAPLWNLAIIASRMHLVWIATVCGKLKTDFRYSNTLGWNTFPVPPLTEKNKTDLTRSAENILLIREAHFPATIADLYDPKHMPADLREVHERNDEILERIYIGRRFRNDTERLEKLFELYSKMTAKKTVAL